MITILFLSSFPPLSFFFSFPRSILHSTLLRVTTSPSSSICTFYLQDHCQRWGPEQWKKRGCTLGAVKDPFRKKGRKFAFGEEGPLQSWTFLELCQHFRDFCLDANPNFNRKALKIKTVRCNLCIPLWSGGRVDEIHVLAFGRGEVLQKFYRTPPTPAVTFCFSFSPCRVPPAGIHVIWSMAF